jgi:hypothetical protein
VIFRPGIMSHPTHELEPGEHQLSQDVLEFLIAHQDWFMLDVPAGESDEEVGDGEGWSIVHPASAGVARRRTTVERERAAKRGA